MANTLNFPKIGLVFWPVGTGDSTTIVVKKDEITFQLDLRHMEKAEDGDEPAYPIIDELVQLLPKKNGRPYLSVFALTHPDQDHILGFKELLSKVTIGEIWHTPRIFRDFKENEALCEDAITFYKEVHRRREAILKNPWSVKAGDRVRIIGHDDILKEEKYRNFPSERVSAPGTTITILDDSDVSDSFEAFVHAPFKVDAAGTRNNTSLSLQINLKGGNFSGKVLFFGDREYPTIKQVFEVTIAHAREQFLTWDILLSPHHCSKKTMYWKDEDEKEETFRQDIMNYFETYQNSYGYVIASANSEFTDGKGDNPPHQKARKQYEKIVNSGNFLCTHEFPNKTSPEPIVFQLSQNGFTLLNSRKSNHTPALTSLKSVVTAARGAATPPQQQVGFGARS